MMIAETLRSGSTWTSVKVFLIAMSALLFQSVCLQATEILPTGFHSKTFRDSAGEHRYVVFVPPAYTPEKNWPIVLFLHGAGEKGTDGLQPISVGLGVALEANPDQEFIAVFPQCENIRGRHLTCWEADSPDGERALQILDAVEKDYSIDTSRRTLCGWSMGGYGAISLAEETPEKWQSVLLLSGGTTHEPSSLQSLADQHVPVWAIHGKLDRLVSAEKSDSLIKQLRSFGGVGIRTEIANVGHNVWRYAFADKRVISWLSQPDPSVAKSISDFSDVDPLPSLSQFYVDHFTKVETIPSAMALRLGNDSLEVISQGIQDVLPSSALEGDLPDIERTFRSGDDVAKVKLSNVRFDGNVTKTQLHAISGGRFRAVFALSPLRLKFGEGRLEFGEDVATTGGFFIAIGHRSPIKLTIEIQPHVDSDGLKLTPLRQSFSISDENWFIRRPDQINVQSQNFTADELMTGLVGGLYLRKSEVEKAVEGVVPALLEVVESELKSREVPKLARVLWPFPALVPSLSVAPSQVTTDSSGLSIVFDLNVRAEKHGGENSVVGPVNQPLLVNQLNKTSHLEFRLSLDAIRALGAIAIRDELAFLNVLDVQDERFDRLADPAVLAEIFPELHIEDSSNWNVGLELIESFSVEGNQDESRLNQEHLTIIVPRASFLAINRTTREQQEIQFSLKQSVNLDIVSEGDVPTFAKIRWLPDAEIDVLATDPRRETNVDVFRNRFLKAWSGWTQENSGGTREIPKLQFGKAALVLKSFAIRGGVASLSFVEAFDVVPIQASALP